MNTEFLTDVAASPPPAAKRRKTSAAANSAPPSTDCPLADKTNCPDRNAVVVGESGDDCQDAAASKSGNDSFQLKVCFFDS